MKRMFVVLLAAAAFAALPVWSQSEPLGLTVGVEARSDDLTDQGETGEFNLRLKPFIDYALGKTGWVFEVNWAIPVLPDATAGWIEAWQEYDFSAIGLDFAIGNDNLYYLDTEGFLDENDALEGSLYGIAIYGLPIEGLSLWGEVDVYYAFEDTKDDFIVDAIFTPTYKKEIGPGTLEAKLRNYFHLYQKDTDAEYLYMELRLSYAMPTGPVTTKFEVRPSIMTITEDPAFWVNALITVSKDL